MPFSHCTKHHAMYFHGKGLLLPKITDALAAEGIRVARQDISKLLKHISVLEASKDAMVVDGR